MLPAHSPLAFTRLAVAIVLAASTAASLSGCGGGDAQAAQLQIGGIAPGSSYNPALLASANSEQSAVLKTLEALVNIETGTGDKIGMAQMGDYLVQRLSALGAEVERIPAAADVVGDNIVGRLKGNGTKNFLLIAHMDTVYPRGYLATAPFHIDGNKAYGPGIGDDKGGIAVILHTLVLLKAQGFKDYGTITVMFNTDEEKGSNGSRDLIQALAAKNDFVLSHEPTGQDPSFITATSGIAYVQADIKGKASHAGAAPELGVNALVEAADLILRTQDIDNKANELRFNWTLAKAGSASNAIPDSATLNADMRYARNEQMASTLEILNQRAAMKRLPAADVKITLTPGRPAFNAGPDGLAVATKAVGLYQELGKTATVVTARTGGGTDAAYAGLTNKAVIEGLGLPGAGFHTSSLEYVFVDAIPSTLYVDARLIMDLSLGR
ncbi:glutamate carboxypeptidase [Variovorax sp. LT1R20]|uniref:glutamate carboxypeptidase n=1 Tax=Variovorax sp. LT1R20 TaxID=3443729 RepID=UPI003F477C5D